MKKISFFALFMLLSLGIEAQVKVKSPHPDVKVKFLRCVEAGGSAILEFTVNNLGDKDTQFDIVGWQSKLYDDEGNVYTNLKAQISGRPMATAIELFPSNIPVKCKIHIENISQYASEFLKCLIPINAYSSGKTIEFLNVPITRD
ncbi:hypothetical protein [Bacteroides fragilis]|uniref:hypothetical protein n=1 Tax=Bacteroides fragilis TaxID=817 RepID=UPI00101CD1A1|nr:hypothetical protein [Bacteroides fragilis]